MSQDQKLKKKVSLPTIPKQHDIRFRNNYERINAFVVWQLELTEIASTSTHQLQNLAKKHLLDNENKKFLYALRKVLKFNMGFVNLFESQSRFQVSGC